MNNPGHTTTPVYHALLSVLPTWWHRDDFVLSGSATLAARWVRDVNDLDVLIKPVLWRSAEQHFEAIAERIETPKPDKGYADTAPTADVGRKLRQYRLLDTLEDPMLRDRKIDIFDALPRVAGCISLEAIWNASEMIDGYRVVGLRHCLAIKALADRQKDVHDMVQLAQLISIAEAPSVEF